MSMNFTSCTDISDAIRKSNALVKQAKQFGYDVLGDDVGPHLNPGDVYDAYEAIEYAPVAADTLEPPLCGPFAAVFLYENPEADPQTWRHYVTKTYDERYIAGFYNGFRLAVPESLDGCDVLCIRGVYDGVMAHAAVF